MTASTSSPTLPANNLPGVLWALTAVGLFTLVYVAAKLSGTGIGAIQAMWLRFVGGVFTTGALVLAAGQPARDLRTSRALLLVARAGSGAFGSCAAVYAASNMPVASASAIGLLDGLFVVILGLIVLHERVSARQWAAILVSLSGAFAVVAAQGAFGHWDPAFLWPAAIALGGAMLVAIESIIIKALVRTERALTLMFYSNLLACALLAVPAALTWVELSWSWIFAFLCLGPLSIAAQYCNIRAFRVADASIVGPVRYAWVVYGALFGAWLFAEPLTPAVWVGVGLILAGGAWLALLRKRAV